MNEKTLAWDDLRLFLAIARSGSLSGAARDSGSSPATLSRRMLSLEQAMGRTLFVRHDRGYGLTPEGDALLASMADVEDRIGQATVTAARDRRPVVKLSAGTWTTLLLLSHIRDLAGYPPDLHLRFVSSEAVLDMPHREVAIGLRNARPVEPNLAGRKVSAVHFAAYALTGAPDAWISVVSDTPSARWLNGRVADNIACEVTSPRNALDLALAGIGKAVLPTFIAERHPSLLRQGEIIADLSHDQWIVTHQDDRHLPEVRRLLDRLYKVFLPAR